MAINVLMLHRMMRYRGQGYKYVLLMDPNRYDGFSKFHVCILDKSATETDYPWNAPSSDVEPHSDKESSEDHDQDDEDDDDDDVEIIDNKIYLLMYGWLGQLNHQGDQFNQKPSINLALAEIPIKFGKKIADELSSIATITVPNCRSWKLGLEKANGRILFVDGWQQFVDYHSIASGYFLVFRYDGFSKFHVYIFDKSCTEIDYPIINGVSNNLGPKKEVADDDDDVEIESERAINAARSCKRTHPSFLVLLRRYNLSFCKKGKRSIKIITKGWNVSVKDNNLKVDDVCVFELVKHKQDDILLEVSICYADEYADPVKKCSKCLYIHIIYKLVPSLEMLYLFAMY
nr:B3 domain-containing protein Os03g0212300-like [Ziziphus jujuba var. spinosa]